MKVRIQKVSGTVLYAILAVTLVILGVFYFGGSTMQGENVVPNYTDPLIYWMYVLLGVAIVITVAGAIFQFVGKFIDAPKEAIRSLIGLIALIAVLVISWSMGSGEPLKMTGYDGPDNVPFWLKLTDMFLYTIYFLMGVTVLLIFGFGIAKKFK